MTTTREIPSLLQDATSPAVRSTSLTAAALADVLHETNVSLLRQVLRVLGADRTTALLADTLQLEAAGGMMTLDGTRRRTPGGTFFQLARQQATPKERGRLFPRPAPQPGQGQAPSQPPLQALTWDEVPTIIEALATTPAAEAKTVKLTLIGKPGKVETRQQCVIFRLQGKPPGPLPKGLPPVPAQAPLTWTVMVSMRQWNRVKESLDANPEDQLILEGYPLMQGTNPILMAQSCVSMLQQRAQKQAQQQKTETTS